MRRFLGALAALSLACSMALGLTGCAREPQFFTSSWFDVFDTVTIVQGYAASQAEWDRQAEALHEDLLRCHRLFDIYNHYDGIVNLYDVNQQAGRQPVTVDTELMEFLQFAVEMHQRTGGACNVAAGAVLRLWHDARESADPVPPDEASLQAASEHTDVKDLILEEASGTVFFADPALLLDVGAVGKGYATELAARAAKERGLTSALLNVGGNVRAIGTKPDGSHWTAGVENPRGSEPAYLAAVELRDGESLVISGDYQRYFEYGGERYHHLIDLTTLQPARYVISAAVHTVQGSGVADALSTGIFCQPEASGRVMIDREEQTEAMWIHESGEINCSDGFLNHE